MRDKRTKKRLEKALIEKALGFCATETVTEYVPAKDKGSKKVKKVKTVKKRLPPDLAAIKTLLNLPDEEYFTSIEDMTDEQLEAEMQRVQREYWEKLREERD